jgi:hypothetical protein
LCNRYGEVKYYYRPEEDYAKIEEDIKRLLTERFVQEKYDDLINPPDFYF